MIWRVNQVLLKRLELETFPGFTEQGPLQPWQQHNAVTTHRPLEILQDAPESLVYITSFNPHNKPRKCRLSFTLHLRDQVTEKWRQLPKSAARKWGSSNWDPGNPRLSGHEKTSAISISALSFCMREAEPALEPGPSHSKFLWWVASCPEAWLN